MIKNLILTTSITFFVFSATICATPVSIPKPKQSIERVIHISKIYFEKWFIGDGTDKSKDKAFQSFFISDIQYSDGFNNKKYEEYSWFITFSSAIDISNSYTFILKSDGKFELAGITN